MKSSKYNINITSKATDEVILFNTLYGSFSTFKHDEFQTIKQILENPALDTNLEVCDFLVQQKHLIENDIDEFEIIENRKRLGIIDKNRLDITIMPTLNCNFSCVYCYETHKNGMMPNGIQERIKKWMSAEMPKFRYVMLHWFGGEPLLNYKSIIQLTKHANLVALESDVHLVKHITTNGYNLSIDKIEAFSELGLFSYQITIDGVPESHNKLRPHKNGKETFKRVFNNVILLVSTNKSIKVTLRINFNHSNLSEIPNLMRMFPKKHRNQLRVSFEPIFGHCEYNAVDNILTDEISNSIASYYTLASELGYDTTFQKSMLQTGKFVYCYGERENQAIINFNGDIFKCGVDDFDKSKRVGYIEPDGSLCFEKNNLDTWMNVPLFDDVCKTCKFLPLCMGGCRKARIANKNTGSNCTLIPTNASYVLKQIAFNGFDDLVMDEIQ